MGPLSLFYIKDFIHARGTCLETNNLGFLCLKERKNWKHSPSSLYTYLMILYNVYGVFLIYSRLGRKKSKFSRLDDTCSHRSNTVLSLDKTLYLYSPGELKLILSMSYPCSTTERPIYTYF